MSGNPRPPAANDMIRREWRRIAKAFAPLWVAALDQRQPSPELQAALARIAVDPALRFFLEDACAS